MHVVLDHAVGVFILARDTAQFRFDMGAEVHARAVPPHKPGFAGFGTVCNEGDGLVGGVVIHGLHALFGQRSGVLDLLRAVRQAQEWITPRGPNFLRSARDSSG